MYLSAICFFFSSRRRHTRFDCDWSSDVCSSDLSEIVSAYADAKIPIYWSALQAVTGSPHVLYFDGFDNFADIEKSGADLAQGLDAHPEIGRLQHKLVDLVAATPTALAFRRVGPG